MTKGTISTFLPEKRYGFIKGEDGRDYYFSFGALVDKGHIHGVAEGVCVEFDQKATPKGYRAERISIIGNRAIYYAEPDEVLISKGDSIKGWEIIEKGDWLIFGESSVSPDVAKHNLAGFAKLIGANALIESEYFKTTDNNGSYHFSVHNFRARAVTIARRDINGVLSPPDMLGLNKNAEEAKGILDNLNAQARIKAEEIQQINSFRTKVGWSCVFLLLAGLLLFGDILWMLLGIPVSAVIFLIFVYLFEAVTDEPLFPNEPTYVYEGSWLRRG
ncbi:MAG: cold shock domain-containing protein [Methylococcaceae bacterium]|jgi:cold shock CspA family protein